MFSLPRGEKSIHMRAGTKRPFGEDGLGVFEVTRLFWSKPKGVTTDGTPRRRYLTMFELRRV